MCSLERDRSCRSAVTLLSNGQDIQIVEGEQVVVAIARDHTVDPCLKIEGLAKKRALAKDAPEAGLAAQLQQDFAEWGSILGNAVQLLDETYVVELEQVWQKIRKRTRSLGGK